jgi:hypothetical protein
MRPAFATAVAALFIDHGVRLVQTADGLTQDANDRLREAADVIGALLLATDFSNSTDVTSTLVIIKSTIEDAYQQIAAESSKSLSGLPAIESQFVVSAINKEAEQVLMRSPRLTVTEPHLDGVPVSAWWDAQQKDTVAKLVATVRVGITAGRVAQEIANMMVAANGPMAGAMRNAETLTHTAVQRVAMDTRNAVLTANKSVVEGLQVVAVLDSRTCAQCLAYDGATYDRSGEPVGDTTLPFNGGPAFHFHCRCGTVPIFLDQPPPEKLTAEAWLDSRTEAQQDDMLGEGRAALYRKGSLTLRDLVSGTGTQLSLAQLREKYN